MAGKTVGELQLDLSVKEGSLDASLQNVEKKVKSPLKSTGLGMGNILGGALSVAAGSLIASGVSTAASTVSGLFSGIIEQGFARSNAIENARSTLTSLGHDAESTAQIMDSALASVKGTAYGLGDAATVAASAVAAGIKPGEDLTKTLTAIGDVAAVAKVDFNEMGQIFNKVAASGKVSTRELNQLSERGVPALDLLSKQLGKTREETQALVTKGQVDFQTFQAALVAGMGGAAQELGITWEGALSNVKAATGRVGEQIVNPLKQALVPVMNTLIGVFDTLAPVLGEIAQKIAPKIGTFLQKLIPKIASFAERILPPLGDILLAILEATFTMLEALEPVFDFIVDGVVNFFTFLAQNQGLLQAIVIITSAVAGFLLAVNNIIPFIVAGVLLLLTHIGEIWDVIKLLATKVVELWNVIVGALAAIPQFIWDTLLSPIISFFVDAWNYVVNDVAAMIDRIKAAFLMVKDFISARVIAPIKSFFAGLWNGIKQGAAALKDGIVAIFRTIGGIVKAPINGIISGINAVIGAINSLTVPDWVPGLGGMSPNFALIPKLAQGGLVSGSTVANIGENGREAVLPLDRNTDNWSGLLASALADEFDARGGGGGSGVTIDKQIFNINNDMDAKDIGRKIMNSYRRAAR